MQYPQIQFYRGSLVRLASGKLKQVEDLSSDDFLESARLVETANLKSTRTRPSAEAPNYGNTMAAHANQLPRNLTKRTLQCVAGGRSLLASHQPVDENNNTNTNSGSVFNSPELTPSFDSPTMDLMDTDYDMASSNEMSNGGRHTDDDDDDDDDDDEELDVVTANDQDDIAAQLNGLHEPNNPFNNRLPSNRGHQTLVADAPFQQLSQAGNARLDEDLYIDSSVVRDFLEVGPPSSASPKSPMLAHHNHHHHHHPLNLNLRQEQLNSLPSASCSSSSSSSASCSPSCQSIAATNLTVLIKFFLESSRSIVFIEVPIEHPFFVFHRGWSSWNPQRTYDKFGLKCRKLKIGDTCISLIRRQHQQQQTKQQQPQTKQQDSDQCNILFSSIKINE